MNSNARSARPGHRSWMIAALALNLGMMVLLPSRSLANTTETESVSDASGTSSITGVTNWSPATTISPTNVLATTYDYVTATTLRTPQNQNSYQVYADSLTINSGGSMGFKGSNVLTIPNLILNGGKIANSATSGNPDMARLAGAINLTASSSVSPNGAGTYLNILATITNSGASSPVLTSSGAGTVLLSAQNTFSGNITMNNVAGNAVLQLGVNNAVPPTCMIQLNGGSNGHAVFDLNGYSTIVAGVNPTSGTLVGYVTNSAAATTSTLTFSNNASFTLNNGVIADNPGTGGTIAIAFTGSGVVTFNSAETYHGSTSVSNGTFALGASGSINNSSSISIAAGATFDVSQLSSYTLGGGATLSASGTGPDQYSTAATINGSGGSFVSLGSQMISLVFTPSSFDGDTAHPSLLISQGDLSLTNNSFIINNASGTPLGAGTYELIQVNDGNVNQSASPAYAVTVTGSGLAANTSASIQVSNGNVNLTVVTNGNPPPAFSNLAASQSVAYGTASINLSGTVSHNTTYPTNGETITVTIDANAQATTINDATGDFSIIYNLAGIPASATPYTITYSYGGDGSLGPASNTGTTLTIQRAAPSFSGLTASQTINEGTATISLAGTLAAGSAYPPAGETVTVNIDGTAQNTTISDSTGDFSISYNSENIPGSPTPYAISYEYTGDASFNGATNTSTALTVNTNTIVENLAATDPINYSSLVSAGSWTPSTTIVPTNALATNYEFVTAFTLRTPVGSSNYTLYAQSLTINSGGAIAFKGNGALTVPNLILNGGEIANSATLGVPDVGQLAGTVNLTTNSSLKVDAAVTSLLNIESVITNAPGLSPTLACSGGGTVILSAQNTFNGSITVAGASSELATILQLGTNDALPAGSSVTLDGGSGTTGPGVLDLNGFSATITNLTINSTGPDYGFVTNSALGTVGTLTLGNGDATETLQYGSIADDPGVGGTLALAKIGGGTLTLGNAYYYDGNTIISGGTLLLNPGGSIPNSADIIVGTNTIFDVSQTYFDLGVSQTLSGGGMVNGSVQADGTVAPNGVLTINGNLTVNGNLTFTLNTSLAQSNDMVSVAGALVNTGTGTLTVNNLGPTLVAGDTFTLFNQPLGNGNTLTIVPPPGVVLTNNLAVDGTVSVLSVTPVPQPCITSISLSGTGVVINGTNGLAGASYNVLTTTNLTLPMSNWTVLPMGTFGGSTFSITNPLNASAPQSYYLLRVP